MLLRLRRGARLRLRRGARLRLRRRMLLRWKRGMLLRLRRGARLRLRRRSRTGPWRRLSGRGLRRTCRRLGLRARVGVSPPEDVGVGKLKLLWRLRALRAELAQAHHVHLQILELLRLLELFGLGKRFGYRCRHGQPISRLMTSASFWPAAGCSTGLVT